MQPSDASPYKQKVFNEQILQFCLGIVELAEFTATDPVILRKALLDALSLCSSLEELTDYWSKLGLLLSAIKNSSSQSQATFEVTGLLNALHTVGSTQQKALHDLFVTTNKLAATQSFSQWADFFVMVKRLKDHSTVQKTEVFSAIRHGIQYLKTNDSIKGLFRVLAEAPQFSGAFAYGQLDSKKWLIDEAKKAWGNRWGTVFVLAGWIGVLPRMMYEENIATTKIRSFDLDDPANRASEFLNQVEVQKDWAYKSSLQDITQMRYPSIYNVRRKDDSNYELTDAPDVVINTSCEHIQNIPSWWAQIPKGTKVILQSNDGFHIPEHVACFKTLQDFAQAMPLSHTDYAGEKTLPEFKRFMLIGMK